MAAKRSGSSRANTEHLMARQLELDYEGAARRAKSAEQGPNSIEKFGLSFGWENCLSFGSRFLTIRKCSKVGSLDMSQNQNGI